MITFMVDYYQQFLTGEPPLKEKEKRWSKNAGLHPGQSKNTDTKTSFCANPRRVPRRSFCAAKPCPAPTRRISPRSDCAWRCRDRAYSWRHLRPGHKPNPSPTRRRNRRSSTLFPYTTLFCSNLRYKSYSFCTLLV